MCLPVVGALVTGAASVLSGFAAESQANAQSKALKRQARLERRAGAFRGRRIQDRVARVVGDQIAGFSANGVTLSGSPTDVITDTQTEGNLDVATTIFNADLKADNLETQAAITKQSGKAARIGGIIGGIAPVIGAGIRSTRLRGAFA